MKVGDYVRTKYGKIGKIINISKNRVGTTTYLVEWGSCKAYYVSQVKDYKSSPSIIDILQVGDYVNGMKITDIKKDLLSNVEYVFGYSKEGFEGETMYYDDDIKSIVTREQMESMEYRL